MQQASSELVAYWQRQLRIEDWDIQVDTVPAHIIDGKAGQCSTWAALGRARIRLADPATLTPETCPIYNDLESTLVHELLHVAIPADQEDGRASEGQERAIEGIAQCLVRLNRGEKR